jgi:hypothetical protein
MCILYNLFLSSQPSMAVLKVFDFMQPRYGEVVFHKIL